VGSRHGLLWGALGAICVEVFDSFTVLRSNNRWPWFGRTTPLSALTRSQRWDAFAKWLAACVFRVAGGAIAGAVGGTVESSALGTFALGISGPVALERLTALAHAEIPAPRAMPESSGTARALQTATLTQTSQDLVTENARETPDVA
jgi:hypothetical protein